MKKIPTIYERDWNGNRSLVLNKPNPACAWVFDGLGVATRKIDGTSCLMNGGKLWKRRELKSGVLTPEGFVLADYDDETGKTSGWMPVTAEDKWHMEAFDPTLPDGTYELIGPKVQGNPESFETHVLVRHGCGLAGVLHDVPRDFDLLKVWMEQHNVEGVVWHHTDGRMAKIKARDFSINRLKGAP